MHIAVFTLSISWLFVGHKINEIVYLWIHRKTLNMYNLIYVIAYGCLLAIWDIFSSIQILFITLNDFLGTSLMKWTLNIKSVYF
jgi:hypothetical protein